MDIVVILAFSVLVFVFLITLIFLIVTCQNRRKRDQASALPPFPNAPERYTCENVGDIDSMERLDSVLSELLENNPWLYEARGILQHVVAVLTLCRSITHKLAEIEVAPEPAYLKDVIVMVMRNIHPRFDDLIESLSQPEEVDIRILEARAMTLGTTTWSLYAPYAVLDPLSCKEVLQPYCNDINLHLMTIRTAAQLSALSRNIEENMNLTDLRENLLRMRRQLRGEMLLEDGAPKQEERAEADEEEDEEDDDEHHPGVLLHTIDHEKIPLVHSTEIIDMIEITKISSSDDREGATTDERNGGDERQRDCQPSTSSAPPPPPPSSSSAPSSSHD